MAQTYFSAVILSLFMISVYIVQATAGFNPAFTAGGPPENFIISIFGHGDASHLYNNLFFILIFGTMYELRTSSKMFLGTFLGSALLANLSAFIFYTESAIIGASGGAMGVLGALAAYRPNDIGLALWVPLPMWAVLVSYLVINFAGLTGVNNVAYEAHIIGLFVGLGVGYLLREQDYVSTDSDDENEDANNWKQRIETWEQKYMLNESD
ncbi:MAG: membrane associated rhomboid family serine protease [Colwellia polaris]|jgi:membrane associated rhomboid family serine protease